MAVTREMLDIALLHRPADVCLVPEKRAELTTEGGLDVVALHSLIAPAVSTLQDAGIRVSLFIDPHPEQLRASAASGAQVVELHTGTYADAEGAAQQGELLRLRRACELGHELGLQINAGHGLHYQNVVAVAGLPFMTELNIGHAIVARAIFVGLESAVREMKELVRNV
jgi:pyridoxine 5-phosphate synthase